jgi:hypothetical protein
VLLGSTRKKALRKHVGEINPCGQFHQTIVFKRRCTGAYDLAQSVSPTELSTGTHDTLKLLMKLTGK